MKQLGIQSGKEISITSNGLRHNCGSLNQMTEIGMIVFVTSISSGE